ncbi:MAG: peptide/nickel transport system ATP-binding protein [Synergistales bacterium]|nr:peptide/nickel transport system ATP-binding protein [Synergistales bacterium]
MTRNLVETKGLKKYFPVKAGAFGTTKDMVRAVDGVDIAIRKRETFALVGESGCGKTTLGRLILKLLEPSGGEVFFDGVNLQDLDRRKMRELRRDMQIIFQDPYASLDPRMRVGDIVAEPLKTHIKEQTRREREEEVAKLLEIVGLGRDAASKYPHQFSGGQRQRIGIARALALRPRFIVCDEAVSALDVSIQAQILNLLRDLQERFNLTLLFITHDLGVVRHLADRVGVMFLGKCVETGAVTEIFENPLHPYTRFLLSAVPVPDPHKRDREKILLKGDIPSPVDVPSGCRFHTRCPYAKGICRSQEPPLRSENSRSVACHFPLSGV